MMRGLVGAGQVRGRRVSMGGQCNGDRTVRVVCSGGGAVRVDVNVYVPLLLRLFPKTLPSSL